MTSNELMNASLLDILFDGRNKSYGAYTLRKNYDRRMMISLAIALSFAFLLVLATGSGNNDNQFFVGTEKKDSVTITEINEPLPIKKPLPKQILQPNSPPLKEPPAAIENPPIKIVPDDQADINPPPSQDDLLERVISDKTGDGKPFDGTVTNTVSPVQPGTGIGTATEATQVFVPMQADPQFPGGTEALMKFLSRNLNTPEDLAIGEKKMVKARFRVDKDGTVTLVEIESSGGTQFDKEVIRVCKKMPKWKPAIQNGQPVPVSYVLPVTFVGEEQ